MGREASRPEKSRIQKGMTTSQTRSPNGIRAVTTESPVAPLTVLLIERDLPLRLALQSLLGSLDPSWTVEAVDAMPDEYSHYDILICSAVRSCDNRCDRFSQVPMLELQAESSANRLLTIGLNEIPQVMRQKIRRLVSPHEVGWINRLSGRQHEVVEMIGRGHTLCEIADQLQISRKTVDSHRENIKSKLGLQSAAQLREFARRQNFEHGEGI